MKKLLVLLAFLPLLSTAQVVTQTINVRLSFDNISIPAWNNWFIANTPTTKDTSQVLKDLFSNSTGIRAVLDQSDYMFDNGAGYLHGQKLVPDTVIRFGSYGTQPTRNFTLIGLNDSSKYTITLIASRLRADGQGTYFTVPGDTVLVMTDTNSYRIAVLSNLSPKGGKLNILLKKKTLYTYLNAFVINCKSTKLPVAKILIDSPVLNYPNSVVRVSSASKDLSLGVQWDQLSGPTRAIFTPDSIGSSSRMFISGLVPGSYKFVLYVSDTLGNLVGDTATVKVNPFLCPICPICPPPVICPVCPVCPAPRTVTGVTVVYVNGLPTLKFTYSDGNP